MIIGLTGSMAAGKSTVSALLRKFGLEIVDADEIAHDVLHSPEATLRLAELFGKDILDENGRIIHSALAGKAFASKEETEKLNAVIHPEVIRRMLRLADELSTDPDTPVVFDVPLLFESGMDKFCDSIIVVAAGDETRYLRIMLRDGLNREQAAQRVEKQMPQEEKIRRADAVIYNDGTLAELVGRTREALLSIGVDPDGLPRPEHCCSPEEDPQ